MLIVHNVCGKQSVCTIIPAAVTVECLGPTLQFISPFHGFLTPQPHSFTASMGNSNSSELSHVRLQGQPKPFRLSDYSVVAASHRTFRIKIHTLRSTIQVYDNQTSQLVYEIKSGMLSSRLTLHSESGAPVFSIKAKTFSDNFRVYEGAETSSESGIINVKDPITSPLVVFAEFEDKVSRGKCRVLVEGSTSDSVSLIYLESGMPNLSPLEKRDNGGHPQYQAIGRIDRQHPRHEELLEVAAGVDETLLLLMWLIRYQIEKTQVTSTGNTAIVSS